MKKFLLLSLLTCLVLSACGGSSEQDKVLQVQEYTQIMKTGEGMVDPVHGKQVKFYYGAVAGTEGTNANGVAYIHTFADGASSVTINLNIALPSSGEIYNATLQGIDGSSQINLGALKSIVGDVRHSVKFFTSEDVTKSLSVKIYRKGKALNTVVAEGTMKEPAVLK